MPGKDRDKAGKKKLGSDNARQPITRKTYF